jgi:hypothetical protein
MRSKLLEEGIENHSVKKQFKKDMDLKAHICMFLYLGMG